MRNAVIALIMSMILILTFTIVTTIDSKTTRQNELDTNLGAAMEQSMVLLTVEPDPAHKIEGKEELIADFIQNFLIKTTSDSKFSIEIITADADKGLLDVKVTETFGTFGGLSQVDARRTVLLEDYVNEDNLFYTVAFVTPKQPDNNGEDVDFDSLTTIKMVKVHGGDSLAAVQPVDPVLNGYTFKGWKCTTDVPIKDIVFTDLSSVHILEDYTFEAVYEKN